MLKQIPQGLHSLLVKPLAGKLVGFVVMRRTLELPTSAARKSQELPGTTRLGMLTAFLDAVII